MKVERVFSILQESSAGMSAFFWVERRIDGYHLMNVELEHCGGPFTTAVDALTCNGIEYAGDYITLTCNLAPSEFAELIKHIDYSHSRLTVNNMDVQTDFKAVMEAYKTQLEPDVLEADPLINHHVIAKDTFLHEADAEFKLNSNETQCLQNKAIRSETEEDGFRAGQLQQLKLIHGYKVAQLRGINPNLPQEEKDQLVARIHDEFEQRRSQVLSKKLQ